LPPETPCIRLELLDRSEHISLVDPVVVVVVVAAAAVVDAAVEELVVVLFAFVAAGAVVDVVAPAVVAVVVGLAAAESEYMTDNVASHSPLRSSPEELVNTERI